MPYYLGFDLGKDASGEQIDPFEWLSTEFQDERCCTTWYANAYDSRQLAHEAKIARQKEKPEERLIILFVQKYSERRVWQTREENRFNEGVYIGLPWYSDEFYGTRRYAHYSLKQPGLVAYTPDDEYGSQDRQLSITPGRYLERFHKNAYTPQQIATFVAEMSVNDSYNIARSVDDIRTIYNSIFTRFGSCMQRKSSPEYDWQRRMDRGSIDHPAIVYADCDLGVAYRGPLDAVKQRAVVWPGKKQFVRIYGSGSLQYMLQRDGYTKVDGFESARIRRIAAMGGYLMPYIDGYQSVTEDSDNSRYFVVGCGNKYEANETCGVVDGDDNDQMQSCGHCGDQYNPEDGEASDDYCASCNGSLWHCEQCGGSYFDCDDSTNVDGNSWCEYCAGNHSAQCVDCEETFRTDLFSRARRQERTRRELTDRCQQDCADGYTWCDSCEAVWKTDDHDECPMCGRKPRCGQTGDLLVDTGPVETDDHRAIREAHEANINAASDECPF